jgi:competence protein ComEA
MWKRLYVALLAVFFVAAIGGGIALLILGNTSPGIEIIVPTATATPETRAYISGAVHTPGVYTISEGERLIDLLQKAGGALEDADLDRVNLAQWVRGQEHCHIPRFGEVLIVPASGDGRININAAPLEQLKSLPGIGDVKAEAIIDYRETNGPFLTTDELMNVDGIGTITYQNLRSLITTGAP